MLGMAIAMSQAGAASAGATDEEAVANKELVRDVVDKTKPAAEGSLLNDFQDVVSTNTVRHMSETPNAAGMSVYFGLASPPTSYGGYGGNAQEDAK